MIRTLLALDLALTVLVAGLWLGAGITVAVRREGAGRRGALIGAALTGLAVLATAGRIAVVAALAAEGWWFAQEKAVLALPLVVLPALVAVPLTVPFLVAAVRGHAAQPAGAVREHAAQPARAARPVPASPSPAVRTALLTTGYGAAAGLVVSLVVGYPATPVSGIVLVTLVAAAAGITRLTAGGRGRPVAVGALGLVCVLAVAAPVGAAWSRTSDLESGHAHGAHPDNAQPGSTHGDGAHPDSAQSGSAHPGDGTHPGGVSVAGLRTPSDAAGPVRRFALTARQERVTLPSGRTLDAWTFGSLPGPALTAAEGDLVEVRLRNADIAAGVSLHWHGYDVPNGEDGVAGVTQDAVMPGGAFTYRFRADVPGTYWYHSHQNPAEAVPRGLFGTLVVLPRPPAANGGTPEPGGTAAGISGPGRATSDPSGPGRATSDPSGPGRATSAPSDSGRTTSDASGSGAAGLDLTLPVHTFAGATTLGATDLIDTRETPAGTPVRLRLVNTDSVPHRLRLDGSPFRVVAIDGRDLAGPSEVSGVVLRVPAGSRYDLAFTMPARPVRLSVEGAPRTGLALLPPGTAPPATASPGGGPSAPGTAPPGDAPVFDPLAYGTPAPPPEEFGPLAYGAPVPPEAFDRDYTMVLDRQFRFVGGVPQYAHTVDGEVFPHVPPLRVREGELVRLTVVNRGADTHPMHPHGHHVLVLSRDGKPPDGGPLWLDTFDVQPGEVWQVALRADNPGLWLAHCHDLTHAVAGMVLHFAYDGVGTSFGVGGTAANHPE
ncbi:multicopper oxidase family protein [Planobispora takensis]|uniref:Multicopper oxidase with three cupredoxin domains (Includes cell division protein FtsP and spore coat protein CotA) n=1 Tax=Planobispora takensis TaxID=1367882 RepID=A0A8J3SZF6_9ACTN|nr:multicopper oxidase family protein [Planobispora takensis]GIH98323.1 hypothetical protein Pta02_03320 [Planobispora takensis]